MTREALKALSDSDLSEVMAWGEEERKARAEKRKQEAIAKIRELAGAVGVTVAIGGARGRPARAKPDAKAVNKLDK
jgi:hypothetical protein